MKKKDSDLQTPLEYHTNLTPHFKYNKIGFIPVEATTQRSEWQTNNNYNTTGRNRIVRIK